MTGREKPARIVTGVSRNLTALQTEVSIYNQLMLEGWIWDCCEEEEVVRGVYDATAAWRERGNFLTEGQEQRFTTSWPAADMEEVKTSFYELLSDRLTTWQPIQTLLQ